MDAIKLRKFLKKRKPNFRMTGFGERKCIKDRWRHAKGSDNKIRLSLKGYPKKVRIGYGGPKAARYLHPSGLETVIVNNVHELSKVDPKTQGVYISSTVGKRKKLEIIKKCGELKIRVLNFKNADDYAKNKRRD